MEKWADYLISQVKYDADHLISFVMCHEDIGQTLTDGMLVDRMTLASELKKNRKYATVYDGGKSWKFGHRIRLHKVDGLPYIRIDGNQVNLDNLGDLPEVSAPMLENSSD